MATAPVPASRRVEKLLEAFDKLSPAEQGELLSRLTARDVANGSRGQDEEALVRTARSRLPEAAERRLRRLMARSEQGRLSPKELADYQSLAREVQRIDAARAAALVELARRRGRPVRDLMAEIDHPGPPDEA
jgi:hypothetical protein